ncbi:MAG TPA: NAD-dependent epimerase/dehydratase family protein [Polyangiaceae bacterium]
MKLDRIAVLGAGGFLGSHLVPGLIERFGCEVDAVDIDFDKLECTDARIRRIQARVEDAAVMREVTSRSRVVLSLTALCNPAQYSTIPLQVIDANFTHLMPLVSLCAERKTRLIHFSTAEVYGRRALDGAGEKSAEMSEDSSCFLMGPVNRERWTYACAKQLLERVIWAHGQHGQLPFTIIRPFNTIGPRMDFVPGIDGEGTPRVLACFMGQLLRGEPLQLVDGGTQKRAFMSSSDMVEAICRVVDRPTACNGEIFNLGNPHNNLSIAELATELARVFAELVPGHPAARFERVSAEEFYGPGYDDTNERIPDISKARRLLGWQPRESLSDMLPEIVLDYVRRYGPRVAAERPVQLRQRASSE